MENFFSVVTLEIVLTMLLVVITPLMTWIGVSLKKTRLLGYEFRQEFRDTREEVRTMHNEAVMEMRQQNELLKQAAATLHQLELDAVENRKDHQQLMAEMQRMNKKD